MATFRLLGVPSSAGAHHAGQDRAPAALRAAGLIDGLRSAGLDVNDGGDVAGELFAVDAEHPTQRNLAAAVRVAKAVGAAVEATRQAGEIPIVVGGDCTITIGVVAGAQRIDPEIGLLYFDGDADLQAPERTHSGILDATGIAHLLGIADTELSRIGARYPLLDERHLVMLGYDEGDPDSFDAGAFAVRPQLRRWPDRDLRADPGGIARQAVAALNGPVVVHFDVDAVDSGDLPLGDFPHYGTGVPLAAAEEVLGILCAAPELAAVVLTEVNPTHDPDGAQLDRYVHAIVRALASTAHR